MIFDAKKATVRRYHTSSEVGHDKLKGINLEGLKKIEAAFLEKLHNLKRYAVPPDIMLPLACKVFDLRVSEDQLKQPRSRERARDLGRSLETLCTRYFNALGHNGYAALNVLTDFATRPTGAPFGPAGQIHSLQDRSGRWVDEFIGAIASKDFRFEAYVADHIDSANRIRQAATH
jgi:hypothetical protein